MIFLPIVDRELRVAARRRGTYRKRCVAVVIAAIIVVWMMWTNAIQGLPVASQGKYLFLVLSVLAAFYCLLAGIGATADCISEEKREDTLGLLFLTDLRGYDVVFGKLAAGSISAIYGLLAIFPLLALPLLLGGVTASEFGLMALTLLNVLFFSLAVGVRVSSASHDERKATFATAFFILLATVGPLLLLVVLSNTFHDIFDDPIMIFRFGALSPGFPFFASVVRLKGVIPPGVMPNLNLLYWMSLAGSHLVGWALLLSASTTLPRICHSQAAPRGVGRLSEWLEQRSYGRGMERRQHRTRLLERSPFLWLAARDRWKPRYVWGLVGAMVIAWFWGYLNYQDLMFDEGVVVTTLLMLNTFLKTWVTAEATTRLQADHRSGALELLLSTPLSTGQIVNGQWQALQHQFAKPLLVVIILEFIALRQVYSLGITSAILAMLVVDMLALGWVGMWLAFRAKNASRAITVATALLLVLPWTLLWCGYWLIQWLANTRIIDPLYVAHIDVFGYQVSAWCVVGLVCDLVLGWCWARRKLQRGFRRAAMQRYHPKASGWFGEIWSRRRKGT